MTERAPQSKMRRATDESSAGKRCEVVDATTKQPGSSSQPTANRLHMPEDTEMATPKEQQTIPQGKQPTTKGKVPNPTPNLLDQICHTHRRLEQLLITLTSKAPPEFIKKMDAEFHKMQEEALHHYNQGLRLKEPLTTSEEALEKSLMHIEIKTLKQKLATLNEEYDEQIELSFELQDQVSTLEGTLANLRAHAQATQGHHAEMTATITQQRHQLAARDQELALAQEQITTLRMQQRGQDNLLAQVQEELRRLRAHTNPGTPKFENKGASSSKHMHTGTSALYSMTEGNLDPGEIPERTIAKLWRELAYTSRERDELRVNLEGVALSPRTSEGRVLTPDGIPHCYIAPRTSIYQQMLTQIAPLKTIMQCYHALKGLNLLVSQIPLLKDGMTLTKPQFERIWKAADAPAKDLLSFMWAVGDLQLPTGIMEVVTASPPFYIGRFILRTLCFIAHHHFSNPNHTPNQQALPILRPYHTNIFYEIKDTVKKHSRTFLHAIQLLVVEDITICYEAVKQYTWLLEHHPDALPAPYTIS